MFIASKTLIKPAIKAWVIISFLSQTYCILNPPSSPHKHLLSFAGETRITAMAAVAVIQGFSLPSFPGFLPSPCGQGTSSPQGEEWGQK